MWIASASEPVRPHGQGARSSERRPRTRWPSDAEDRPLLGGVRCGAAGWSARSPGDVGARRARPAAPGATTPGRGRRASRNGARRDVATSCRRRAAFGPAASRERASRRSATAAARSATIDRRLEPVEQVGDRLVDRGDAGHGHGAGDDEDRVGAVRLVVGLPQRVGLVPAAHVGVDARARTGPACPGGGTPRGSSATSAGWSSAVARRRVGGHERVDGSRPGRRVDAVGEQRRRSRRRRLGLRRASARCSSATKRSR